MERSYLVGIRREDKSVWERRAVLAPNDIMEISLKNPEIRFVCQPSKLRIFSDKEYADAGAIISEDLSVCDLILGVKEVPSKKLIANKTYMFFSHVIKAQSHNMDMLDTLLQRKIRLIDYEKIVDEKGNRLIAFGVFAGYAGALDFLAGLGHYLLKAGFSSPLLNISYSYKYFNLEDAYACLKRVSEKIVQKGIDKELRPLIFAVTGRGKTATGVLKILRHLPVKQVHPDEIAKLVENPDDPQHTTNIYVTNINTEDVTIPRKEDDKFTKQDFNNNPQKYKNVFNRKYLPYISCLFHCIYWDSKFPKYIKNKHLERLAKENNLRLLGISDVTCDSEGSIECLKTFTSPDQPFFFYDPLAPAKDKETFVFEYKKHRIMYLALDYLPCELAFDATTYFSNILKKWISNVCHSDPTKPLAEQGLLPELQRAVITLHGDLTPPYQYITQLRLQKSKSLAKTPSMIRRKSLQKHKKEEKDEDGVENSMIRTQALDTDVKDVPQELLTFD